MSIYNQKFLLSLRKRKNIAFRPSKNDYIEVNPLSFHLPSKYHPLQLPPQHIPHEFWHPWFRPQSHDYYRGPTELVLHFAFRGSSHRRNHGAARVRHTIDMVRLYRSPIPVGRREAFNLFKRFLPAFVAPRVWGGGVAHFTSDPLALQPLSTIATKKQMHFMKENGLVSGILSMYYIKTGSILWWLIWWIEVDFYILFMF